MFACYLIIASVLALVAGYLAMVHLMFMRSEPGTPAPLTERETQEELPPTTFAAPNIRHLATTV